MTHQMISQTDLRSLKMKEAVFQVLKKLSRFSCDFMPIFPKDMFRFI